MYNLDEHIEEYGNCGIQMRVQDDREGEWALYQDIEHVRNVAKFTLVINRDQNQVSVKVSVFFTP